MNKNHFSVGRLVLRGLVAVVIGLTATDCGGPNDPMNSPSPACTTAPDGNRECPMQTGRQG